jgi:hypothetical protein
MTMDAKKPLCFEKAMATCSLAPAWRAIVYGISSHGLVRGTQATTFCFLSVRAPLRVIRYPMWKCAQHDEYIVLFVDID